MDEEELLSELRQCGLFRDLTRSTLLQVARRLTPREFPDGATVLRQGEGGMGFFFVVLGGEARIDQGGEMVRRLRPGEFFGEITALRGGPRTASVTATAPLRTLTVGDSDFQDFLEDFPRVTFRILEEVCSRFQALATDASVEGG